MNYGYANGTMNRNIKTAHTRTRQIPMTNRGYQDRYYRAGTRANGYQRRTPDVRGAKNNAAVKKTGFESLKKPVFEILAMAVSAPLILALATVIIWGVCAVVCKISNPDIILNSPFTLL